MALFSRRPPPSSSSTSPQAAPESAASSAPASAQSERSKPNSLSVIITHPTYLGFMFTVGIGVVLGLYWIASNTTQLLAWILTALIIALGLNPIVQWLEKQRVPRVAGIIISVLILAGILTGFIATIVPTMVNQTTQIINDAPRWVQDFLNSPVFVDLDNQFQVRQRAMDEVNNFFSDARAVGGVFGNVVNIGQTIINVFTGTLIVLILSLYFLAALPSMKNGVSRLAPRSKRPQVEALTEDIVSSVGNYLIGQCLVSLLNGLFAFIVMSFLNVPFALTLAFMVALLAFIPLIGSVIAEVVVSLIILGANSWQAAAIYAILYFGYLQFEAYLIAPRIMKRAVAVPATVTIISVIAGGSLLGPLGAFIAIPTAAVVMILVNKIFLTRQDQR